MVVESKPEFNLTKKELAAPVTARELGYYLRQTHLKPQDFEGKRVLNIAAGKSDLQKELEDKHGVKCTLVNVDISYDDTDFISNIRPQRFSFMYKIRPDQIPANPFTADAKNLPFLEDSFDMVISSWLDMWQEPLEKLQTIKEMKRVARGNIYIIDASLDAVEAANLAGAEIEFYGMMKQRNPLRSLWRSIPVVSYFEGRTLIAR